MKLVQIGLLGLFIIITFSVNAQNHYNIRLNAVENSNSKERCYNVQLSSADLTAFNLAGQNYRLYFDASKLRIKEDKSVTLLPNEKYTPLILKDNINNANAIGAAGKLGFEQNLSFINLGNDLKDETNGGIVLPASGEWISTANVCFDLLSSEDAIVDQNDNSIFWARPALTAEYATAYVEIAEWINPTTTIPAKAAIYFDEEASTSTIDQQWEYAPIVYPNPVDDRLFVEYEGDNTLLIQLYTIHGQLIMNNRLEKKDFKKELLLGNFPSGMYQLRLSTEKKTLIKKIEIIH